MKIAVGSDHAGYRLKADLVTYLKELGCQVFDHGTDNEEESVDYPDYALSVAGSVAAGEVERGLLICGTGQGMAITANKVAGVRAVVFHDVISANFARSHNDSNILAMGGRITTPLLAREILRIWLSTPFSQGRHSRRIDKIIKYERERDQHFSPKQ